MWGFCFCLCLLWNTLCPFLVLQSSWRGRESWLLCFRCFMDVLLLWMFCDSSSRCHGSACSVWMWYFLIIITYFLLQLQIPTLYWYTWETMTKIIVEIFHQINTAKWRLTFDLKAYGFNCTDAQYFCLLSDILDIWEKLIMGIFTSL